MTTVTEITLTVKITTTTGPDDGTSSPPGRTSGTTHRAQPSPPRPATPPAYLATRLSSARASYLPAMPASIYSSPLSDETLSSPLSSPMQSSPFSPRVPAAARHAFADQSTPPMTPQAASPVTPQSPPLLTPQSTPLGPSRYTLTPMPIRQKTPYSAPQLNPQPPPQANAYNDLAYAPCAASGISPIFKLHHAVLTSYLFPSSPSSPSQPCPARVPLNSNSRSAQKLHVILLAQLHCLTSDLYAEVMRRTTRRRREGVIGRPLKMTDTEMQHWDERDEVNGCGGRRSVARQKLSMLAEDKFRRLVGDVLGEVERRFPGFAVAPA